MRRRDFLAAAAALGSAGSIDLIAAQAVALPAQAAAASRDEPFWELVRSAFPIPADRIYLNVATLGVQPLPVLDAVVEHTRRVAMSYPPATDWAALKAAAAAVIGADPDGLAFPRNTTEAMNFIAGGLELEPGDEVVTTRHEHIGGLCCWELAAARRGVRLQQVPLPAPASSDEELLEPLLAAVTPRTRVISVSHVLFTNGTLMPVQRIGEFCRERGIIFVVDGAHPPGMMAVDVRGMHADFYASSPHKWLCAPQGTGLLYMAEPWRTRLWPTLASGGWDDMSLGAHRFNHLGTLDESRLAGLHAALRFHNAIGPARVHARIRHLRTLLLDGLQSLPRVRIMSPVSDALGAGMVAFSVDGADALHLQRHLAERANVRTRVVSEYDYGWMRLSPHVYTSEEEVARVVELVGTYSGSGS